MISDSLQDEYFLAFRKSKYEILSIHKYISASFGFADPIPKGRDALNTLSEL